MKVSVQIYIQSLSFPTNYSISSDQSETTKYKRIKVSQTQKQSLIRSGHKYCIEHLTGKIKPDYLTGLKAIPNINYCYYGEIDKETVIVVFSQDKTRMTLYTFKDHKVKNNTARLNKVKQFLLEMKNRNIRPLSEIPVQFK